MLSDGTWSYTWQHGRQLASMTNGTTTVNFGYDASGMRTSKTVGNKTWQYVYNGSTLSYMTDGTNKLFISYDANGPMSVTYNGTEYYYVQNGQGDVIAITNSSGTVVVTYEYDPWGKLLYTGGSMANTLGQINPLRYRGYVYDTETGLYYLQSRYYNPKLSRFICSDVLVYTGQGILGFNMFAYCLNNPVTLCDPSGNISTKATIAKPKKTMSSQSSVAKQNREERKTLPGGWISKTEVNGQTYGWYTNSLTFVPPDQVLELLEQESDFPDETAALGAGVIEKGLGKLSKYFPVLGAWGNVLGNVSLGYAAISWYLGILEDIQYDYLCELVYEAYSKDLGIVIVEAPMYANPRAGSTLQISYNRYYLWEGDFGTYPEAKNPYEPLS